TPESCPTTAWPGRAPSGAERPASGNATANRRLTASSCPSPGLGRSQEGGDVVAGAGAGEQVALAQVALDAAQPVQLVLGLDPLGDGLEAEGVGERQDGGHDGGVVGARPEAVDEGPVDLEHVDGEPPQVRERRVAGAEVV